MRGKSLAFTSCEEEARAVSSPVAGHVLYQISFDARMTICRFFVYGTCRDGNSCKFDHERSARPEAFTFVSPTIAVPVRNRSTICHFFEKGRCNKGDNCLFVHPQAVDSNEFPLDTTIADETSSQKSSNEASSDSRGKVPCRSLAQGGGCRNPSCPYLHQAYPNTVKRCHSATSEEDEVCYMYLPASLC